MAAQTQLGIRLPENLIAAIDAMVAELTPPGMRATRSDVIRILLWDAINRRAEAKRHAAQKKD